METELNVCSEFIFFVFDIRASGYHEDVRTYEIKNMEIKSVSMTKMYTNSNVGEKWFSNNCYKGCNECSEVL